MHILLVLNEHAGNEKARRLKREVCEHLAIKQITFDLKIPEYFRHALEIVQSLDLSAYDAIVAAGGDGTVFEVLNGYMQNETLSKPPFGVIPLGTGNAFSRDLFSTKTSWVEAVESLSKCETKLIDTAFVKGGSESYYFVGVVGFGLITEATIKGNPLKKLGPIADMLAAVITLFTLKARKLKLTLDGVAQESESFLLSVSNTNYISDLLIAPKAISDDGLLDVVNSKKMSKLKLLSLIPTAYTGKHILCESVDYYTAKEIVIETETPWIPSPGGELLAPTPLTISCIPKSLRIFI